MDANKKNFQCEVCEKSFKQPSVLVVHQRIHNGERPHVCDFCGKGFAQAGSLTIHRRLHSNEKPYGCDVCQKAFTHSGALNRHKKTHTGDKPHGCDVCSKKFADKGALKIHKRTHTNEKPYECELCEKRFRQVGSYKYHKETHNKDLYECGNCKKHFKNSLSLRRHQLNYEKDLYKCDVCKCKSFANMVQFERHNKCHSHIYNCYYAGLLPIKKKMKCATAETPSVIVKEDGGKSIKYLECNKKACGETVLHYHKTIIDKNLDKSEQRKVSSSKELQSYKPTSEKEASNESLSILDLISLRKVRQDSNASETENFKQLPLFNDSVAQETN